MRLGFVALAGALVLGTCGSAALASAQSGGTTTVTFSYTGALQTFVVPVGVKSIGITAVGAGGGYGNYVGVPAYANAGGTGASVNGFFKVKAGQSVTVLVGGSGGSGRWGGGGGGGSFAYLPGAANPLIAAGGGGGAGYGFEGVGFTGQGAAGGNGEATTNGGDSNGVHAIGAAGGTAGAGGGIAPAGTEVGVGGGGGGWSSAGDASYAGEGTGHGGDLINGGSAGGGGGQSGSGDGGYGGGGGGGFGESNGEGGGGGGGGGYSGGTGNDGGFGGGGGGSYAAGNNLLLATPGSPSGQDGQVVITYSRIMTVKTSGAVSTKTDGAAVLVHTGMEVHCPAGGTSCTSSIAVTASNSWPPPRVGSHHVTTKAGAKTKLHFKLNATGLSLLTKAGSLEIVVDVTTVGDGQTLTTEKELTIQAP